MKLGTITRGDQKIYILLSAEVPQDARLVAESRSQSGSQVPAIVATKDKEQGEYVVILPLLHAEQTLSVKMLDASGAVLDELVKKIRHLSSALSAKYNTFSKNPGVEGIRNFDRYTRNDVSHIHPDWICHFGFEKLKCELVRILITSRCDDPSTYHVPYTIKVFDRQGKELPITHEVTLRDKVEKPVENSDMKQRTIHASFRKPYRHDWFFIWVRFEDDALPPAFLCMDKWHTERLRNDVQRRFIDQGQGPFYEEWFYITQKRSEMELEGQREARFDIEPTFSIIVPLYKTPIDFFEEMIQSVLDQTYGKYELVLVNSTPEDAELVAAIERHASEDERIRVITLDKNYGIAGNTNEGIRAATGDFLCFFDHDDLLEPSILFEYVAALNRYPETDLLYCDEDKICDGRLLDGMLKPDFSWELLTTRNYICHLLTVRKSIVDTIELSGDEVTGAQDWDMTMKVCEKARNVFHVRKVLYHWRLHQNSSASGAAAKTYTHEAGERALYAHFKRIGIPVKVTRGRYDNIYCVEYLLPDKKPKVSIIIPNKDNADMLERCVDSIYDKSTYPDYEIVIVENNSTEDETFGLYERLEAAHSNLEVIRYEGPFNYSDICNLGAKHATGEHFLFLNNDMEIISPNWIEGLLGPLQREEVGVVGAALYYPDDNIQHIGVIIPRSGAMHVARDAPKTYDFYFGLIYNARDVVAVTGACLLLSRADYESIDGFDTDFAVAYNDVDLCLRLREKGRHVIINPNVELYHYESISRGFDRDLEGRTRFVKEQALLEQRWTRYVAEGDPCYGINVVNANPYYALDWSVRA